MKKPLPELKTKVYLKMGRRQWAERFTEVIAHYLGKPGPRFASRHKKSHRAS